MKAQPQTPQARLERLSCEVMAALRGSATQRHFSESLGFTSNVAYLWESGRRFPEASTFFRAALLRDAKLATRLKSVLRGEVSWAGARLSTPNGVLKLIRALAEGWSQHELAQRVGVDRTTVARWLRGASEPRLPELFQLLQVTTQQLLAVVGLLTDPANLPSVRDQYLDEQRQKHLAYNLPWSHALLRALELENYQALEGHVPGFLAAQIGIDAAEESALIEKLAQSEQIRWNGSHWELHQVLTIDTRSDPVKNRELKAHWTQVGLERLRTNNAPADALFSYNLFSVSEGTFQQLRKLQLEYFDRVRSLISESETSQRVVLMNLHLVPLEVAAKTDAIEYDKMQPTKGK